MNDLYPRMPVPTGAVPRPYTGIMDEISREVEERKKIPVGEVKEIPPGSIGDINSTAKGSAARFNAGKAPMELIPLRIIADNLRREDPKWTPAQRSAIWSLAALGGWQENGDPDRLHNALRNLGADGWAECARVFDYGRKKYAEWNWAKGQAWNIPLACAARHLLKIIAGEDIDPESNETHRGHVFCNVVMLLTFIRTYPEGDNRPRCLA